jgi:hypothetical protein
MNAMRRAESAMRAVWLRGLSTRRWDRMADSVASSLLESYNAGRGLYLPEAGSMADMTAFFERARAMTVRAKEEVETKYQAVESRHGDEMTAILYMLFFSEDASTMRRVTRGIPAPIARRAARFDVPMASARRAQEIVSSDPDARALVLSVPSRSSLVAMSETRRALNIGIADAAISDGRVVRPSDDPTAPGGDRDARYPLWQIREVMDSRTRGNPTGIYRDDGFHWQVDGYIATMEDIVRQDCVPPCGHNCRAQLVPVPWSRAERLGLVSGGTVDWSALRDYNAARQTYIDKGLYPDPGFR